MKHLTKDEERAQFTRRAMVAVGLECHLHNLVREIRKGDTSKLVDFQQYIQYANTPTRERIAVLIRKEDKCQRT